MRFLLIVSFLFLVLTDLSVSKSEILKNTKINGNSRISSETIIDLIGFKKNKNYNFDEINDFQKKIFKSGFFKDVKLKIDQDILLISVVENPIIEFYYIEGLENSTQVRNFLDKTLNLKQNKIFSESLLKSDLEIINKIMISSGYYDFKVEPILSLLKDNSVNLIIKVNPGRRYRISKIFFIGDKYFESSKLHDVIQLTEHGWWKFLSTTTILNEERISYDKTLLKNFYLDEGFFNVQLNSSDVDLKEDNTATITYSINSGKLYNFFNPELLDKANSLNVKNKSYIENLIKKNINGKYSREKIILLRNKIYDFLNLNKIDFVKVNIQEIKDDAKNLVKINFILDNEERKFVNLINVSGNSITEEKVIRDNIFFSEGDAFTNNKLKKSYDKLKNTGIFKTVKTEIANVKNELVDVKIKVEEQPTGSVSAGIAAGTNNTAVTTGIQEKNLFGKGIISSSNISFGTEKIIGNIKLTFPDFNGSGNRLTNNFYAVSTDFTNAGYESSKVGNEISVGYEVYEDIFFNPGFGIETDSIDVNDTASILYKNREGRYNTGKIFYNLSNDKRNRKFQTSDGYKVSFGQSLALPGSDIQYLYNNIDGIYYYSFSKDYILKLSGGVSSINSINDKDIKLSDRLFLSSRKLRGFESYGIGPKDGSDFIGGNYSSYTGISTTLPNPLPDNWNANSSIFIDSGNVWGVDFDSSKDSNKIRSSYGLSLDWMSPLGPLSFVLSDTISKADGDLDQRFSFQLGTIF